MGYVGMAATNTATNNMLLFMRGPDDGQIRVRLSEGSGLHVAELRDRLRTVLPEQLVPWTQRELQRAGYSAEKAAVDGPQDSLRFRAGRHRQRGHELRLSDPGGGDGGRPGPESGPQARAGRPRGDAEACRSPRRSALPAARLPGRGGGHRPSESGPQPGLGQRRHRRALGGHVFQSLCGQELLARSAHGGRLPGPGRGALAAHGPSSTDWRSCPCKGSAATAT